MSNPFQVVKDFEKAVGEYTGAPYVVSTSSCTMALLLAVAWHLRNEPTPQNLTKPSHRGILPGGWSEIRQLQIEIPKRTYVSVPQSIIHAGGWPVFRDEDWLGMYQLKPLPVWDAARWFTAEMFNIIDCPGGPRVFPKKTMLCVSFHASKTLGDTQGGAILHDDDEADAWLRRARFDGRTEGVAPKDDTFNQIGYHCYMSPDVATRLLWKLSVLPKHNDPLPNDDYPDLSEMEIFK